MAYSRSICTNLKAERSYMRLHWVDLSCCTYTFLPQSAIVLCLRYFGCAGIINVGYFTLQKQYAVTCSNFPACYDNMLCYWGTLSETFSVCFLFS